MNNNPLISIVLPSYNVAQYLQQCLESVAAQTYRNIEVIIIIDGATDGSYEIAQEFCKKDDRFSVYWQENAGSGPARNTGLSHCTGKFVMFVDPDDWIEPELLEKLYEAQQVGDYDLTATKRTIALCDSQGEVVKTKSRHYKDEIINGQQEVRMAFMCMLRAGVVSAPTEKLYKLSIIREHQVEFPSLKRSQDIVFNYRYYNHISSLRLIAYSGYNYRLSVTQALEKVEADYYKTIVLLYNDYVSLYQSWGMPFPKQEMSDWFFRVRIYSYLQKMAGRKQNFKEAVEHPVIRKIILSANPKGFHLQLTRRLLLSKSYKLLNRFLQLVLKAKQH